MNYKWVYGDGQLELASGYAKGIHHYMLLDNIADSLGKTPENYNGGTFSEDSLHGGKFDTCQITWQGEGNTPTKDQIKFMIQQKLHRYQDNEAMIVSRVEDQRIAAGVEDTEPEYNFGFLSEPHKNLYPPAFEGSDTITEKAKGAIKNHVLEQLKINEYPDADQWIYFTVYGSGISYNWDEDGDFDVQMWIDINKFNQSHAETPSTSDDLIAEVRRIVQMVNFPSFKDLGLSTDDEDGGEGRMLIQFYPKPGEGTEEENLSSKPYACYDLETDKWLYHPKPLTPEFYGEHFLAVMQKAEDIAIQAEALLEELQRNTISWQFWTEMQKKFDDPKYQDALDEVERNAEAEKEGVKTLFVGVFGGRAEAYSPEGEGIYDERDIIQKLLEVWGVFQRLKHFARQELPWEEQEMPAEKESKWPWQKDPSIPTVAEGIPDSSQLNDPVRVVGPINPRRVDPYRWWDFRADPEQQIPLTDKTRWLWTPQTGLHVWNVPWGEGEVYHAMYVGQIPGGETDFKGGNAPSGYLLPNHGVFAYEDMGWDRWGEEAIEAIKEYQGEVRYITNDYRNLAQNVMIRKFKGGSFNKFADWSEIMQNAQYLRNNNMVQITNNGSNHVEGTVASQSEPGTVYNTSFDRQDPNSSAITTWNCNCPWGSVSWGRTRQWKKYEGRPCKHTLAMYWQSQAQPLDEAQPEAQGQQQLFNPAQLAPQQAPAAPGAANMPAGPATPDTGVAPTAQPPTAPLPAPAPTQSQPVPLGQGGSVAIPGALSKLKVSKRKLRQKKGSFTNGQVVVCKTPLWGIDRDDNQQMIPVGSQGEVLYSDDKETIVIFPTDNGILEPHLVRVQSETKNFRPSRARTPFVKRRV